MNTVIVKFTDSRYNYSTAVADNVTEEGAREYFVNTLFNVGVFPEEIMAECIAIEFIPKLINE